MFWTQIDIPFNICGQTQRVREARIPSSKATGADADNHCPEVENPAELGSRWRRGLEICRLLTAMRPQPPTYSAPMNDVQITNHVLQNKSFPRDLWRQEYIQLYVKTDGRQTCTNDFLCWCAMSRGWHLNLMEDSGRREASKDIKFKAIRFMTREGFPQLMISDA